MSKLHVVITRAGDALLIDGVNTYIWNLASALSEAGLEVTVCSGYGDASRNVPYYVKTYFGINFKGSYVSLGNNSFGSWRDILFTWGVKGSSLMRKLKPDIIHVNGAIPLLCRAPKVVTYHGIMNFHLRINIRRFVLNRIYNRFIYRSFNRVLAVSRKAKDELLRYGRVQDITVISPMISRNHFKVQPDREHALLHRGTYPRKNLKATLLAFSRLKKEISDAKLWVVGDPQNVSKTAQMLGLSLKNIEVFYNVSRQELTALYSQAKVTVFPSLYEAFGYVALESLACGTPVIATRAVAEELIKPGYNGFLVSPNDPDAISIYAHRLLTDEELWRSMSRNSIKVAKEFEREKILPKILSIYNSVIKDEING